VNDQGRRPDAGSTSSFDPESSGAHPPPTLLPASRLESAKLHAPPTRAFKLGLRARLFLISAALMTVALVAGGAYLEHALRAQLEERIESELIGVCRIAKDAVERVPDNVPAARYQELAMNLGRAARARITVVHQSGKVLADSEVDPERVATLEPHGTRPEIIEAKDHGRGVVRRHSLTLDKELLYAAIPYQRAQQHGFVRVSRPLQDVDLAVGRLRVIMMVAALVGIVFSVFMSFVAAHSVTRTIRDMFSVARAVVRVEQTHLESSPTGDEIGGLAGSINEMAQAFADTVGTLARERDRFGAVLEGMSEALLVLDGDARIIMCNRAALQLLSWKEAPIGRTLLEAIRQPALHDLARRVRRDGKAPHQVEVETRGGKTLLARAAYLSGSDGGVVLVMRDITELRRLEHVRRDFVANVSHELRTPVSTIRATAEALLNGALDDRDHAERFSRALLRNAERLSRIISDLLDLSRAEAGEREIEPQPVPVGVAVHRALEIVEDNAQKRGLTIESDIEPNVAVQADEKAFDHVLLNLIDNAVKYTPDGGCVQVWARKWSCDVRIEVRDTGPGVPEQHRERIFERFYRVDKGRSRDLGGTGLGLAIVRHLVESMGGKVGYQPRDPEGSIFWVTLPVADRPSAYPEGA